jgi:transposase-like protein
MRVVHKTRTRNCAGKLEKVKDAILNERYTEKKSISKIAMKYGINENTLGYYLQYWKTGEKRVKYKREDYKKRVPSKPIVLRKFSKELKAIQKRNQEMNNIHIKHYERKNNPEDQELINNFFAII